MAMIQWNALSTSLFGSFEAVTLLPDAAAMGETEGRLPVLYLLHDNGENALQFLRQAELEMLCEERKMAVCCPWLLHSFGQDLRWGGKFGRFAAVEFPGICENMFAVDNARAAVGGIGTGAYAACFLAREYPGTFRKAVGFDGRYDMVSLFRQVKDGQGAADLTVPMMEAAFGDPDSLAGSSRDLFAGSAPEGAVLGCSPDFPGAGETRRLAAQWGIPVHTGTLAQVLASAL